MVHEYTERWKGFQFRAPVYLDGRHDPHRFDLVKWVQRDEPIEVIDLSFGDRRLSTEYCYTIGWLKWNPKDGYFDFDSCGTRYLRDRVEGLEEWILEFCDRMEKVLGEEDD